MTRGCDQDEDGIAPARFRRRKQREPQGAAAQVSRSTPTSFVMFSFGVMRFVPLLTSTFYACRAFGWGGWKGRREEGLTRARISTHTPRLATLFISCRLPLHDHAKS